MSRADLRRIFRAEILEQPLALERPLDANDGVYGVYRTPAVRGGRVPKL